MFPQRIAKLRSGSSRFVKFRSASRRFGQVRQVPLKFAKVRHDALRFAEIRWSSRGRSPRCAEVRSGSLRCAMVRYGKFRCRLGGLVFRLSGLRGLAGVGCPLRLPRRGAFGTRSHGTPCISSNNEVSVRFVGSSLRIDLAAIAPFLVPTMCSGFVP